MTNSIKRICVFASSSNYVDKIYYDAASELGKMIAETGHDLVYGGSQMGLMYACASSAKSNGSKVYAVMPEKLASMGLNNKDECDEFIITEGMRERKAKLDELSDATITIAGGFGTLEEISEMIVQKQLGYNCKPVIILNTNGFYDDLLKFFDRIIQENFANKQSCELYYIAKTPQEALQYISTYTPNEMLSKFARV